ncbi:GspE/PulE family protein [Poseidonibacter lekithochrous]|uniref:GspE/PulE family protein n=1 Tax=Poseidonibacter TaxID=2321187 RepID=UPI001C09FCF5|nr:MULTISPECIES: GspE/PulE family protein [Poseidonibacter]MBU3015867.1 GspE/PulE family protein [Poseidonibacter lekithochrous]MDO6829166.1 GspE/PulE family protein [Poseidonibacter sp. 1_MG-2023]
MNIQELHNINLLPYEVENYSTALKSYVLFSQIDDKVVIAISKDYMSVSFDYLSKFEYKYEVIFLDEISYERLYNKFLEIKTDKEMSDIQQEQEDATVEDEDFSVSEFLKVGSDILTSEESAPIIKFVNSLFYQAIKKKASDIHIEMHEFKAEVRYRVDGVLVKHIELDKNIMSLVISRIKVISNLDISEKRIPQDGRTAIKIAGKTLDIRVSILPTFYGERVVMRILMQSEDILSVKELGFPSYITDELEKVLRNSYGMVLVTGPTGSGKSTTLHSLLHQVVSEEKNIITVEDPVEYKSNEFSQIQVNAKVGLTFASGLRSILRQDPDIIMLGEIRDKETASIAVQSALTGHLLFSTLHTNRAPAAITRLIDMGVEKFLISSSLLAVLAQRLVRKLCSSCKCEDDSNASHQLFKLSPNTKLFKPKGCKECNFTGYIGRIAIGELFIIDDEIKEYLKTDVDDNTLMKLAHESGMISLDVQLKQMLENGDTSVSEAVRIGLK